MELAERVSAAVPTSADSFANIGTFTVPAGVKRLKKVRFGIAPDHGTSAISVRSAPILRLSGSGLLEQNPHLFVGKFSSVSVVTTGGLQQNDLIMEYDCDIPVQTGGTFAADLLTIVEAVTAGSVLVNVEYDDKDAVSSNSMSDYVSAAVNTAADAFITVGTLTIPKLGTDKDPKKIVGLAIGVALDQGTSAISLRTAPIIRLSGAGIKGSGNHDYIGPLQSSSECGSSASQGIAQDNGTVYYVKDIDINAGGQILVEEYFVTEVPTAGSLAVGVIYR